MKIPSKWLQFIKEHETLSIALIAALATIIAAIITALWSNASTTYTIIVNNPTTPPIDNGQPVRIHFWTILAVAILIQSIFWIYILLTGLKEKKR